MDVFADGHLTRWRQDHGISLESAGFQGGQATNSRYCGIGNLGRACPGQNGL